MPEGMVVKRLLLILFFLSQCPGLSIGQAAQAQTATTDVFLESVDEEEGTEEEEEEGEEEGEEEEEEEEPEFVRGFRVEVFIKNVSSFDKTLTAYDNICRRYVFSVKRFRAYQKERVKLCINEEGYADVTVSRITGSRKKRYREVEERDTVKFL